MTDYYIGEIRLVAFNYAPVNFHDCDGTLLPINQNQALFAVLGTTYGGDGVNTFALPDLRSRVPVGLGQLPGGGTYAAGGKGGTETVALTIANTPAHTHTALVSNQPATTGTPSPAVVQGSVASNFLYVNESQAGTTGQMSAATVVSGGGGGSPHENRQPSVALRYIIALNGIFPSQN